LAVLQSSKRKRKSWSLTGMMRMKNYCYLAKKKRNYY
jgi:hypothetical protein